MFDSLRYTSSNSRWHEWTTFNLHRPPQRPLFLSWNLSIELPMKQNIFCYCFSFSASCHSYTSKKIKLAKIRNGIKLSIFCNNSAFDFDRKWMHSGAAAQSFNWACNKIVSFWALSFCSVWRCVHRVDNESFRMNLSLSEFFGLLIKLKSFFYGSTTKTN